MVADDAAKQIAERAWAAVVDESMPVDIATDMIQDVTDDRVEARRLLIRRAADWLNEYIPGVSIGTDHERFRDAFQVCQALRMIGGFTISARHYDKCMRHAERHRANIRRFCDTPHVLSRQHAEAMARWEGWLKRCGVAVDRVHEIVFGINPEGE